MEIADNDVEFLADYARDNSADDITVIGISKYAIGINMKKYQRIKNHFDSCIRPVIDNILCSGYSHKLEKVPREFHNNLGNVDLVEYYQ